MRLGNLAVDGSEAGNGLVAIADGLADHALTLVALDVVRRAQPIGTTVVGAVFAVVECREIAHGSRLTGDARSDVVDP